MALSSKDLYPHSIQEVARRLGVSVPSIQNKVKKITDNNWTWMGSGRYFNNDAITEFENLGVGRRSAWKPKGPTAVLYATPHGAVSIDVDIPLPSIAGTEVYPFHVLEIGQSFAIVTDKKNLLEKQVTHANKDLLPKKFTRRFLGSSVRIWRTE